MAFHTPNPKLQALEKRNAELRSQVFAKCFRALVRGLDHVVARVLSVAPRILRLKRSAAHHRR